MLKETEIYDADHGTPPEWTYSVTNPYLGPS